MSSRRRISSWSSGRVAFDGRLGGRVQDDFDAEFHEWPAAAQNELLAKARLLEQFGPILKRPHADTLKGSRHANMEELRFDAAGGVWRVAFFFDPERRAILLVGGSKAGVSERRFYKALLKRADERYNAHLAKT